MALIPITDVLSQDQDSFKVQTNGMYDHRGHNSNISVFGDLTTGSRVDDVSVKFQYNISTFDTVAAISGTGVNSHVDSKAIVSTGAGIGDASLRSKDIVRYRPGHEAYGYFTAVFSLPDANAEQHIGTFDSQEGFWVGYQGTSFGLGIRNAGVDTFTPQASWNGDQLLTGDFILNPQTMNIYKISYGWLGIAPITFEVSADNGKNWTVIHKFDYRNAQTVPSIKNPMLPVNMEAVSTSAPAAPVTIGTSSWNGGNIGGAQTGTSYVDRFFSIDAGEKTITASTPTNLLTVRNPALFEGEQNHIKSQLMLVSATTDGNQSVKIVTNRGATIGGTPSFNDVSTGNSQLQFDISGTTATGGIDSFPMYLAKADAQSIPTKDLGLFLQPGEDVTFIAESGATNTITLAIRERSFF
jgi:hypothetical protein